MADHRSIVSIVAESISRQIERKSILGLIGFRFDYSGKLVQFHFQEKDLRDDAAQERIDSRKRITTLLKTCDYRAVACKYPEELYSTAERAVEEGIGSAQPNIEFQIMWLWSAYCPAVTIVVPCPDHFAGQDLLAQSILEDMGFPHAKAILVADQVPDTREDIAEGLLLDTIHLHSPLSTQDILAIARVDVANKDLSESELRRGLSRLRHRGLIKYIRDTGNILSLTGLQSVSTVHSQSEADLARLLKLGASIRYRKRGGGKKSLADVPSDHSVADQ